MRYRVEMDISFATEEECLDFIDHIKLKKDKIMDAIVPQGPSMTMPKYLRYSECRHDEVPPAQCGPYMMVDWET